MDEEAPQKPVSPIGMIRNLAQKKFDPKTIVAIAFVVILIFTTLGVGLGFMRTDPGDPTPTGTSGSIACNDWTNAPPTYQTIFTEAANRFNIQPALLGAIFLQENGKSWKTEPWPTSPDGATGPFQFMPATWNGIKSGCGTEKADNLSDAACGAAKLLATNLTDLVKAPTDTAIEQDIKDVAVSYSGSPDYFHKWVNGGRKDSDLGSDYVTYNPNVWQYFQELNVGCVAATGSLGFTDALSVPGLHQCAFGNAGICDSGCSQTSLAMVARYFGSKSKTPMDIKASGLGVDAYIKNNPDFKLAEHFITEPGEPFPLEKVTQQLAQKHPMIFRFNTYTENGKTGHKRGHYVVIVGISSDKTKIYIEDPFGWIPTYQPKKNGNPPLTHLINPDNYGLTSDGHKFEFWATQDK